MDSIVLISLFAVTTITFFILFLIYRNKFIKLTEASKKQIDKLNSKIGLLVSELKPPRKGYYLTTLTIVMNNNDPSKNQPYDMMVHVKEIDRYTNGECKVEIIDIDCISGFDPNQIDWVKNSHRKKFKSVMKVSEITWLESEEDIKELRRKKIEEIEKNEG